MKSRLLFWLLLLFAICCAAPSTMAQTNDGMEGNGRKLRDLHVFSDTKYGQWAGSGEGLRFETVEEGGNPTLPVDERETYNGLPSYRVNITGEEDWWNFILAGPNWETYNIAPYYPDGLLEFNVKGAEGGETFQVALRDTNTGSEAIPLYEIIEITDEWQHVQIPLSYFFPGSPSIDLQQLSNVEFSTVDYAPLKFWLNDIKFTSTGDEPSFPAIKLNQLGYLPNAPKIARVSGFDDLLRAQVGTPFQVRNLATNEVAYEGELSLVTQFDEFVSGERVLQADFSPLTTPGDYYITIDAYQMEDSPLFSIGGDVYDPLVMDTARYFYLQRSGMPLEAQFAGQFARAAGHLQDAEALFASNQSATKDVSGGWYDAGDYGKYVNAGALAVSDLLWAYEMFPNQFPDNHLNIPENGNNIPDILDEIRWELDWMLKMQDERSGGFYHMVQPTEETTIPDATEPRFIEDDDGWRNNVRPTSTTGSAVAALAHAALIYEAFDPDYAQQLLAAAEAGWAYLEDNRGGVEPVSGPYSDDDDTDDRFWAATALYRATGNPAYHDYIRDVYDDLPTLFSSADDNAYGVAQVDMLGWLNYLKSVEPDAEVMSYIEPLFTDWAERMALRWQDSAWNIALLDEDFYWGSNYVVLTTPFVMYIGAQALGQDTETSQIIALQALDYLLGTNPLQFSFVSGYGENSLQHPLSEQWLRDGITAVPDGVLAGGPNAYSNPLFYSNFAGKRYTDVPTAWTTNEHTIYWNSVLVFHAALAAQLGEGTAVSEPITPPVIPTRPPQLTESGETADTADAGSWRTAGDGNTAVNQPTATNSQNSPITPAVQILTVLAILILIMLIVVAFLLWRLIKQKQA